jgi:hypothetical protein
MSRNRLAAILVVLASCGPETTSFRTTDKGDGTDRSPPAAAYAVRAGGRLVARVHVWSNGGYIGNTEEPMTHVGFEVENPTRRAVIFDGDALALSLFDNTGAALPPARFTAITPLGPSQLAIAPGETLAFDSYFWLPVLPRVIDHMRVQWVLRADDERAVETTSFTRDDEYPVTDYRTPPRS